MTTDFTTSHLGDGMWAWAKDVCSSYSRRMRVTNFTYAGNSMFHDMLFNAIGGQPVFFVMEPNGRPERKIPVQDDNDDTIDATDTTDKTDTVDNVSDDDSVAKTDIKTVDAQKSSIPDDSTAAKPESYTIQSSTDPVAIDSILDPTDKYAALVDIVDNIGTDGKCYDDKGKEIPGLYCLSLSEPPYSFKADALAARAESIDGFVGSNLDVLLIPQRYAANTDPDTDWEERSQEDKDAHRPSGTLKSKIRELIHFDQYPKNTHSITTGQYPQWDTSKITEVLSLTAQQFMVETSIPPVDFPVLQTLNINSGSLISNREPFISRVAALKMQINAIFQTAGIPELQWDMTFPYTPSDIASIGDAAGKGINADTLRKYNLA